VAQRTEVILIDDVDGGKAAETIAFALDGVSYEIDLSSENAAKLRDGMALWMDKGRRTGGRKARGGAVASSGSSNSERSGRAAYLKELRTWARANGFQVADRGRIAPEVEEAFENRDR
jgi:hypothetical protein